MKLIILRGYPGSGKTTIGKHLQVQGFGTFIDHNKILTFLASIVGDDDGIYDDIHRLELAMTEKLLHEKKSVIVARGFSSQKSIEPYTELTASHGAEAYVITLNTDQAILAKRVIAPTRKEDFNPTTSAASLNDWITKNPLQAIRSEHIIDSDQSVEEVCTAIEAIIT